MSDKLGTLGEKLQEAYEAKRRQWAGDVKKSQEAECDATGHPSYERPPPGELPIDDSELG